MRLIVWKLLWGSEPEKVISRHRLALRGSYPLNYLRLRLRLASLALSLPKRKVIVISQIMHMGDILACEPVIRHVRRTVPDAFIVFALHKNYRALADSHPEVDYTLAVECVSEWIQFAQSRLFNRVIDLNIYGRSCPICNNPWNKPAGDRGVTIANYYDHGCLLKAFAIGADIEIDLTTPNIYPTPTDVQVVDALRLPREFVSIHAGANDAPRRFPIEKWKIVVDHINRRWGIPVIEIGLRPLLLLEAPNRSLSGGESILQSAEIIKRSMLYLGSDSGPAHLANAAGTHGIILLGWLYGFRNYMPYSGSYAEGEHSEMIHCDGPVAELNVDLVLKAIDRRMSQALSKGEPS